MGFTVKPDFAPEKGTACPKNRVGKKFAVSYNTAVSQPPVSLDRIREKSAFSYDTASDVPYNWNRYYLPERGQYNRLDPFKDRLNWYLYTSNNPLRKYDFNGLTEFTYNKETGERGMIPSDPNKKGEGPARQEGEKPSLVEVVKDVATSATKKAVEIVVKNKLNIRPKVGLLNVTGAFDPMTMGDSEIKYVLGDCLFVFADTYSEGCNCFKVCFYKCKRAPDLRFEHGTNPRDVDLSRTVSCDSDCPPSPQDLIL